MFYWLFKSLGSKSSGTTKNRVQCDKQTEANNVEADSEVLEELFVVQEQIADTHGSLAHLVKEEFGRIRDDLFEIVADASNHDEILEELESMHSENVEENNKAQQWMKTTNARIDLLCNDFARVKRRLDEALSTDRPLKKMRIDDQQNIPSIGSELINFLSGCEDTWVYPHPTDDHTFYWIRAGSLRKLVVDSDRRIESISPPHTIGFPFGSVNIMSSDRFMIADLKSSVVRCLSLNGSTEREFGASRLCSISGLLVDEEDDVLYVGDYVRKCVEAYNISSGAVLWQATKVGFEPRDMCLHPGKRGHILVANVAGSEVQILNYNGAFVGVININTTPNFIASRKFSTDVFVVDFEDNATVLSYNPTTSTFEAKKIGSIRKSEHREHECLNVRYSTNGELAISWDGGVDLCTFVSDGGPMLQSPLTLSVSGTNSSSDSEISSLYE